MPADSGVFLVSAKFMGISMEKVEIVFQVFVNDLHYLLSIVRLNCNDCHVSRMIQMKFVSFDPFPWSLGGNLASPKPASATHVANICMFRKFNSSGNIAWNNGMFVKSHDVTFENFPYSRTYSNFSSKALRSWRCLVKPKWTWIFSFTCWTKSFMVKHKTIVRDRKFFM